MEGNGLEGEVNVEVCKNPPVEGSKEPVDHKEVADDQSLNQDVDHVSEIVCSPKRPVVKSKGGHVECPPKRPMVEPKGAPQSPFLDTEPVVGSNVMVVADFVCKDEEGFTQVRG